MFKRTLVGAAILAAALACWRIDAARAPSPAWTLAALNVLLVLGTLNELLRMTSSPPGRRAVGRVACALWIGLLVWAGLHPAERVAMAVGDLLAAASAVAVILVALQVPGGPSPFVQRLAGSLWFQVSYVGGVACLLLPLLSGQPEYVFRLALVVKSSDIAAYFVGSMLGRHPLAPRVSPKKTIEGAVAGVLVPALIAVPLLSGVATGPHTHLPPFPGILLFGLAAGILAVVSNLTASLIKRARQVKDSGTLFGEAGGVLDLADSLLLVGPLAVAYTAWAI